MRIIENTFLRHVLRDPLRLNASFLISASWFNAIAGFLFWAVASRLYKVEAVGEATALISAGGLVIAVSGLGMGIGAIRFFAEEKNKNLLINTAITIVVSTSIILSTIFIFILDYWLPAFSFIRSNSIQVPIFILFCIFSSVFLLYNNIFTAFLRAQYAFYQNLVVASKIIFVIILVQLNGLGIFVAYTIGLIVAVLIANIFFRRLYIGYKLKPTLDRTVLKNILFFSVGNYIGDTLKNILSFTMALCVINILGAEQNAYYYIAWMMAGLLFNIAYSVNNSFVADNAANTLSLRTQIFKSFKFVAIILIPSGITLYLVGGYILELFGESYSFESLGLLQLLIISSVPLAINEIGIAVLRVQKRVVPVILIYAFNTCLTITMSCILLNTVGIMGFGIAWLCANIMTLCIVVVINLKYLVKSPST